MCWFSCAHSHRAANLGYGWEMLLLLLKISSATASSKKRGTQSRERDRTISPPAGVLIALHKPPRRLSIICRRRRFAILMRAASACILIALLRRNGDIARRYVFVTCQRTLPTLARAHMHTGAHLSNRTIWEEKPSRRRWLAPFLNEPSHSMKAADQWRARATIYHNTTP